MKSETKLVIYKTPDGDTQLDVTVRGDTIWLTQLQMAELFGTIDDSRSLLDVVVDYSPFASIMPI